MTYFLKEADLEDGTRSIAFDGELDLASAPALERAAENAIEAGATKLEVDLAATTFIDSTAIRILLRLHQRLGGQLAIVGAAGNVFRVFEITGLLKELSIARPAPHPVVTDRVKHIGH